MKNDPLCIKEDVCDMSVCDGVLKIAVLAQQTPNNERDAIAAWLNHCTQHLKMNGPGCDVTNDGKCKHWFIMGYKAATAPMWFRDGSDYLEWYRSRPKYQPKLKNIEPTPHLTTRKGSH